ncbi:MAG: cadherin repeat domain-containing protein, partial [Gammaproteobacteria bacterium]|nr:cadherin repeat domain-containing protein [Gammaproteobacteria bacterium]
TTTSYSLTVSVSDGTNTGTGTITVTLSNVNDNDPVVTAATFEIAESATNGTAVGTVVATDPDPGTSFSAWAITAGNTGTAFAIDGSSGDITVNDGTQLDYETTSSYTLTVRVSDGTLTGTGTITVDLDDVNETPVVTEATLTVDEDADIGTNIGTAAAIDPDGNSLSGWKIIAGNTDDAFDIVSSSGEITVAQALDYETTSSYSLTVEVSDSTLKGIGTITVDLNNLNDNDPVVTAATFTIAESATNDTAVGTAAATDPDDAVTSFTRWPITAGNTGTAFAIDSRSGEVTVVDETQR